MKTFESYHRQFPLYLLQTFETWHTTSLVLYECVLKISEGFAYRNHFCIRYALRNLRFVTNSHQGPHRILSISGKLKPGDLNLHPEITRSSGNYLRKFHSRSLIIRIFNKQNICSFLVGCQMVQTSNILASTDT
jgi:hypothetical protein